MSGLGLGLGVEALKIAPKEQAQRFAVAVIASVIAVTLILPIGGMRHSPHNRDAYIYVALFPAAAAWFVVWQTNGSQGLAMFRTAVLAVALVGVGGLTLIPLAGMTAPWIEETISSSQFIPQALVYVGIGVLGIVGSSMFENDE